MDTDQKKPEDSNNNPIEGESLEAQTLDSSASDVIDASNGQVKAGADGNGKPPKQQIKGFFGKINIYLLLFVFVIIIAIVVTGISYLRSKSVEQKQTQIVTEPLSQEALDQLRQTDVKVGDPKQVLSVESNAVFAGRVLIRGGLEVAGEIKSTSPLSVNGLTVTGNTILSETQASVLQVTSNATIQGQLNVQNNLSVSGSGSFGGSLTASKLNVENLQINGDLQFTRHLDAGGGSPSKSDGTALGAGGTSSVSGTDTAGTVAINTGGGTSAGCFVTVTFNQKYNDTPHVVITPVGIAGGSVNYYISRNTTSFSICTANAAPSGQSFAFDYIVVD
jgi:cytoskeletal protein CcmA (bactofilin family)